MSESDEIKVGDIILDQCCCLVFRVELDGNYQAHTDKRIKPKKIGVLKVGDYVFSSVCSQEMIVTGVFFDRRRVATKNWYGECEYPLSDIVLSTKENYEAAEAKYCEDLLEGLTTEKLMAEVVRRHNATPKP